MKKTIAALTVVGLAVSALAQSYPPNPGGWQPPAKIKDVRWAGGYLIAACDDGRIYRTSVNGGFWQGVQMLADVPPTGNGHWRLFSGHETDVGEVWAHDTQTVIRVYEGNRFRAVDESRWVWVN